MPNYSPNNNRTVSSLLEVAIKQSTHLIQHRLISTSQLVHFQPAVSNINIYIYIVRENPIKKKKKKTTICGWSESHSFNKKKKWSGRWFMVSGFPHYVSLSIFIYLSIYRSIDLSIYLSIYMSTYLDRPSCNQTWLAEKSISFSLMIFPAINPFLSRCYPY